MKRIIFGVASVAAIGCGVVIGARFIAPTRAALDAPSPTRALLELHVPHAGGPIVLDGELDDLGWLRATARTNAFVDGEGQPAHPYSDARFVWGDGQLYVALYAADEDLRATRRESDSPLWLEDSFHLAFAEGPVESIFDISPLGTITDARRVAGASFDYAWQSGTRVSSEADGTLNDSTDDDEEWVLELSIPLSSLELKGERGERIGFSARRCDRPKGALRVCAFWGEGATQGVLILD